MVKRSLGNAAELLDIRAISTSVSGLNPFQRISPAELLLSALTGGTKVVAQKVVKVIYIYILSKGTFDFLKQLLEREKVVAA